MTWSERIKRYCICILGIFSISFGVALITKSSLGTSPISVIPYTLSLIVTRLSYGTWVALFNMLLAVIQIAFYRRDTDWFDIVQQLVFAAVFGSIVDVSMALLAGYDPQGYGLRVVTMFAGIPFTAFGAYLTLISRVGVMAGDGFARAISGATHLEFGRVRVITDSSMAIIAAAMSFAAFGSLVTVREATVCAALLTGLLVGVFNARLKGFEYFLLPQNREPDAS